MSELRKHYFLDEYCIIATERRKRPTDFRGLQHASELPTCPFCPGNEHMTPPASAVYMPDGRVLHDDEEKRVEGWSIRCVPNKFPALSPSPTPPRESPFWVRAGYGFHEVIVETPRHDASPPTLDDGEMELLMRVYAERCAHYLSIPDIEYVSLFKNFGKEAGASLSHTHTQLIAMPFLAPRVAEEVGAYGVDCPMCTVLDRETDERVVWEDEHFEVLSPYCAKVPFEMWVVPKRHTASLHGLSPRELVGLGSALRYALRRLHDVVGDVPYNYMFLQHPSDERYHMYIRIVPKLSITAGFELGTDVYINVVSPEDAASYLRG